MRTAKGLRPLATVAVAGMLALSGGPAMAAAPNSDAPMPYTCTGGEIPSGNYASITVTGPCVVPLDAVITVVGNVNVAAGAMLDAQSASSTITVGRNVTGAEGSLVGLGCQPPKPGNSGHECMVDPEGHSTITVHGNVTMTDAFLVMLNGTTVHGNVTLSGGGSPIPWSVKNNAVSGNVTVNGQTVGWLGVMFNHVGRNVTLTDITVVDEHPGAPGVYVVRNTIARNLTCMGLVPGVSFGFYPGQVNNVGGNANGQCENPVS